MAFTGAAAVAVAGSAYAASERADAAEAASRRQKEAQMDAAQLELRGKREQLEFLREGREKAMERQEPFRQAGLEALGQYQNILQDPSQLEERPGFQFLQEQGQQAVDRSASARGMQLSGSTLQDLQQRGQNVAAQYRGQILGEIGQLINTGQSAAAGQASTAFQGGQSAAGIAGRSATNLANLRQQTGQIGAASALAQGQASASVGQTLGNLGSSLMQYKMLKNV